MTFDNDGIATTIAMASVYASDNLRIGAFPIALPDHPVHPFFGSIAFGRLAEVFGAKPSVLISLVIWILIRVGAFLMPPGRPLFPYALGAASVWCWGAPQALARSLFGSMIPGRASAEFFGFFSVFSKFSAIWGPLIFALVSDLTGSARYAILSLIFFLLVGGGLLMAVDVDQARASRLPWDFEGAEVGVVS